MGVSKVIYGNNTLIDLTGDTVTAEKLMSGETAHGADGNPIVGTATGANLQASKTVAAGTSNVTVTPDSGYDGLEEVIVEPTPTIATYATPSETGRILYPPTGKYFSEVEIDPIPSEYIIPYGDATIPILKNGVTGPVDVHNYSTATVYADIHATETTLWTNPKPTSNFGSTSESGTTISLSAPLTDFDQIAIYVRYSTSDSQERKFIYDSDSLNKATSSGSSLAIGFMTGSSSSSRVRLFYKYTSSKLGFPWATYRLQQGSQTASAAYIIPTKIIGIKLYST